MLQPSVESVTGAVEQICLPLLVVLLAIGALSYGFRWFYRSTLRDGHYYGAAYDDQDDWLDPDGSAWRDGYTAGFESGYEAATDHEKTARDPEGVFPTC
jgi:hypothetical protein